MKFKRQMANRALVVGLYQTPETADAALKELRRQGFRQSVGLRCSDTGALTLDAKGIPTGVGVICFGVAALLLGVLLLLSLGIIGNLRTLANAIPSLAAFALTGAFVGWFILRQFDFRVSAETIARFKRWILRNETIIIVEADVSQSGRALTVFREGEGESPVLYAFQPECDFEAEPEAQLLRHEPPSGERLARAAIRLASAVPVGPGSKTRGRSLLRRLTESERILQWTDRSLAMAAESHQACAISAEWLLDNAYLIRAQIGDIRKNLPKRYYTELPTIVGGPHAGMPAFTEWLRKWLQRWTRSWMSRRSGISCGGSKLCRP